jgi:hypothetical protein
MRKTKGARDVITLADLSPRHDVKGGSRQRIFGADAPNLAGRTDMKTKLKDLTPKSPGGIKGGKLGANDNITLVRAAKPKATGKDLTPKSPAKVKGGGHPDTHNDNITLVRAAKPKATGKDLTPKSPTKVKGGGQPDSHNDNITLVRAAKPSKKRDLPPRKDVKGGKKAP